MAKQSTYKIINAKSSKNGSASGKLTENGVVVATIKREASASYIHDFKAKFLSDASKARFESFADCLSVPETLECLFPK